jgi:nicotinamide-nucleotide amidase
MRLEILCTGDELLDGSVLDTNSAYFQQRAFAAGARTLRKETVPDDCDAIAESLAGIGARADFALVSGGMGPTSDDVTVEAAARAAGVTLVTDQRILAQLERRFAERGVAFSENNARQARVPEGCEVIPNRFGAAPMLVVRIGRADCHLLPGVPSEFRGLCDEEVLPRLERGLSAEPARVHRAFRALKIFGLPESHVESRVKDLPERHPHVRFGYRAHAPEIHLKLLAEAGSPDEARARLLAVETEARAALGDRVFGADGEELSAVTLSALRRAGATVALAESCTGGLCSALLTEVPGASGQLVFSAVAYQEVAKTALLGVSPELLAREGPVCAAVTEAMARAARAAGGATFGAAVTGWAGPEGGTEANPVGTVFVCLTDGERAISQRRRWVGDRERVRRFAAYQVLDLLRRNAGGLPP